MKKYILLSYLLITGINILSSVYAHDNLNFDFSVRYKTKNTQAISSPQKLEHKKQEKTETTLPIPPSKRRKLSETPHFIAIENSSAPIFDRDLYEMPKDYWVTKELPETSLLKTANDFYITALKVYKENQIKPRIKDSETSGFYISTAVQYAKKHRLDEITHKLSGKTQSLLANAPHMSSKKKFDSFFTISPRELKALAPTDKKNWLIQQYCEYNISGDSYLSEGTHEKSPKFNRITKELRKQYLDCLIKIHGDNNVTCDGENKDILALLLSAFPNILENIIVSPEVVTDTKLTWYFYTKIHKILGHEYVKSIDNILWKLNLAEYKDNRKLPSHPQNFLKKLNANKRSNSLDSLSGSFLKSDIPTKKVEKKINFLINRNDLKYSTIDNPTTFDAYDMTSHDVSGFNIFKENILIQDTNGNILAIFIKNIVDSDLMKQLRSCFASSKPSLLRMDEKAMKTFSNNSMSNRKNKNTAQVNNKKTPTSSASSVQDNNSGRCFYGSNTARLYPESFTMDSKRAQTNPGGKTLLVIHQIIEQCESAFKQYAPELYEESSIKTAYSNKFKFVENGIATTVVANFNTKSKPHVDAENVSGAFSYMTVCYGQSGKKEYTGGETALLGYEIAFDVEEGDLLIANFKDQPHANLPFKLPEGHDNKSLYRCSLVAYNPQRMNKPRQKDFIVENSDDEMVDDLDFARNLPKIFYDITKTKKYMYDSQR